MDVTLIVNGLDLSKQLSTYNVTEEVSYRKVVTTMDEKEHAYPGVKRPVVTFSLLPMTDRESTTLFNSLYDLIFNATFTNQHSGIDETRRVRLTSNLDSAFLLLSVDGKRRYRGGEIQMRAI